MLPPNAFGVGEEAEDLANRLVPKGVPAHRLVGDDAVKDAPPLATRGDVPRLAQVSKDQCNAAFAQSEPIGHVAHSQPRLVFDRVQEPPVVREE